MASVFHSESAGSRSKPGKLVGTQAAWLAAEKWHKDATPLCVGFTPLANHANDDNEQPLA
jgi:hypothetical protein